MKLILKILPIVFILIYLIVIYGGFYFFMGSMNLKSPYSSNIISFSTSNEDIKEVFKYVALGDSLTAGVGSEQVEDTYVYNFAKKLAEKDKNIEMLNLGIPGARTDDVIIMELPQALEFQPDYVTLLIGVNDIHNKSSLARFENQYRYILDELLTKTDAKILLINIPFIGSKKSMLPPFNFWMKFRTRQFNSVISKVVEQTNNDRIKLIDLYNFTYKSATTDNKYYSIDLYHPSGYGYKLWGQVINDD